jgi:hypothetical protein
LHADYGHPPARSRPRGASTAPVVRPTPSGSSTQRESIFGLTVGDLALLAVIGDSGLNIARLHLKARPVTARLTAMLSIQTIHNSRF